MSDISEPYRMYLADSSDLDQEAARLFLVDTEVIQVSDLSFTVYFSRHVQSIF